MAAETEREVWDAIVVGAGPAGCAASYDLVDAGHRVLLLDRSAFPRPKACAGALTAKAVRALRYSIEPVVRRWESRIVLEQDPSHAVTVSARKPICAMTVREELDAFCLARTVERGAVFRRIPALAGLVQGPEWVELRLADGSALRGRYVVGADGVGSRVRALLGEASWFRTGFALEANVAHARPDERFPLLFDFAPVPGGYGWLFPRDNHVNVGLYVPDAAVGGLNREALERYIAARCGPGRERSRTVGQFLGLGAAAYLPEPGTRVLLTGDAAGFVDPLTGEGIYGAIRSGQAAAAAIDAALGEGRATAIGRSRRRKRLPARLRERQVDLPAPLHAGFAAATGGLRSDLEFAERAANRFYRNPARSFQLMRLPLVPSAVLYSYSKGLPLRQLGRALQVAGRIAGPPRSD